MKKVLFIINPNAGIERTKVLKKDIAENLDHNLFQHEIVYTEYAKHGTELAKVGVEQGFDVIVAVGGDGSVNDVVNGIYGTDAVLGIIPKGSGNGLARSLKIPVKQASAIRLLNQQNIRKIDVGEADGHLFVSNAGVGFDTVITEQFRKSKHRGLSAYLSLILKNVFVYPVKEWSIEADRKRWKSSSFMLTAANAIQLGYGFKMAPEAQLDDGYFDFVSIKKFPKVLASVIAFRAFTGKISGSRFVSIQLAKEIRISHPDLKMLQFDGEAVACGNQILIKMMPNKLNVIF